MENFERIKVVGKGSYGEVWLSKHQKDKKHYVLKKMDLKKASKRERKAAEQEAKLLSKLKHPNIVGYKDSFEEEGYLWIAMSYCEGGDLYNTLKTRKGSLLEERQIVEWFVQISMALQYLHERNILHRDLKTQNIFLTRSKIIKLGDLGIARVLDNSNDMATTLIGTPYYMSPELFSNKPYNHKSDVWALGCCVYEMATLKHAFNAKDMNSLVYKILRGRSPPMPVQYSTELTTLIRAMLDQNPARRPSVNKILRDPFIKKNIAIFLEGTRKSRKTGGARSQPSSARPQVNSRVEVPTPSGRNGSAGKAKERPTSGKKSKPYNYNPTPIEKPRPLPEIPSQSSPALLTPNTPTPTESHKITGNHLDELDECQRTNPNMSARARRRERSMREETPRNSYEGIQKIHLEPRRKGSASSDRPGSSNAERGHRRLPSDQSVNSHKEDTADSVSKAGRKPIQHRQTSLADDDDRQTSLADDDDDESSSVDNDEERQQRTEEKEAEQLERMLDATLHIQVDMDEDTLEVEEAAAPLSDPIPRVKSEPVIGQEPTFSKETLNSSGRLMERIVALRKDCLHGVGLGKLHKAYQILDDVDSDNMEDRLRTHLGDALFDEYAGKIWQLKFCEESAFRIN